MNLTDESAQHQQQRQQQHRSTGAFSPSPPLPISRSLDYSHSTSAFITIGSASPFLRRFLLPHEASSHMVMEPTCASASVNHWFARSGRKKSTIHARKASGPQRKKSKSRETVSQFDRSTNIHIKSARRFPMTFQTRRRQNRPGDTVGLKPGAGAIPSLFSL